MTSGWVAGSVRATAMARRRLGADRIDLIGAGGSPTEAIEMLARSPYGHDVRPGASLVDAERGIAAGVAWNLRVLAGWLPPPGADMLRALAGWFEIANIEHHIAGLTRAGPVAQPIPLGSLAIAWPRLAATASVAELRATLATSAWGDPGSDAPGAIAVHLRLVWADRVAAAVPAARDWAAGGGAVCLANERFVRRRELLPAAAAAVTRLLGRRAAIASSLAGLRAGLAADARWVLAGIDDPGDLWRAEPRWWVRIRNDGRKLLASPRFGPQRPLGAIAALAFDAWRTRAALAVCSRHGAGREVLDATR